MAHRIFFLFYILIFIYFFKYETIVRSSAWSFSHSDPYPCSVILYPLIISIKIDELSNSTLGVKTWTYFDKFICLVFFINMPFKSRVKSRVHTRDLKGLLIKKYKTNVLIIDIDLKEMMIKNTRQMRLSDLKGMLLLMKNTIHHRDHLFITSAKGLGGWGKKMSNFADFQYYLCWHRVGGSGMVP